LARHHCQIQIPKMQDASPSPTPLIYRFHNHTDAAMWACRMRDEGHRAYLLDETTSWLWGPLAVGGIRVAVYPQDPDAEHIPDESPPPPPCHQLPDGCTIFTLAILAFGLLSQLVAVLYGILAFTIYAGVAIIAGLLLMPMMLAMVRNIRERPPWMRIILWLVVIFMIAAVFPFF
jgi:hypothetical protein